MAVEPATGRLYVAGAEIDPASPPAGRPRMIAGPLKLMVFAPVD